MFGWGPSETNLFTLVLFGSSVIAIGGRMLMATGRLKTLSDQLCVRCDGATLSAPMHELEYPASLSQPDIWRVCGGAIACKHFSWDFDGVLHP